MTTGELDSGHSIAQSYANLWRSIEAAPTRENAEIVSNEAVRLLGELRDGIEDSVERSLVFSADKFYKEFDWINGAFDELVTYESDSGITDEVFEAFFSGRINGYKNAQLTCQAILDNFELGWFKDMYTKTADQDVDIKATPDWIRKLTKHDYIDILDAIFTMIQEKSNQPIEFGSSKYDSQAFGVIATIISATDFALISGSPDVIVHLKQKLSDLNKSVKDRYRTTPSTIATADMLFQKILIENKPIDQSKELLQFIKEEDPQEWQGAQEILTFYMLSSMASIAIRNYESLDYPGQQRVKNNMLLRFQLTLLKQIPDAPFIVQNSYEAELETPTSVKDVLKETELDWTVLPKGEDELRKSAEEIIDAAMARLEDGVEPTIDLERLNILTEIRSRWGEDMCYFARGKLKRGASIASEDGTRQPDEYIVLVLQEYRDGKLIEHAVAESPIAGPNALYVCRADVSPKSWREVYSIPKKDARALGARRVKHTCAVGDSLISVMANKVETLLTATPTEFATLQFNGRNKGFGIRIIDLAVLQSAQPK